MTRELIQEYTLKISHSSRTEIIVVLFEICEHYIDDAIIAFWADDHDEFKKQCGNAQKVINDLIASLDFDYEIALPLYRIYEYISKEIASAVIKNAANNLATCKRFLSSLKESFEKIAKEDASGPVMGNSQTVYAGLTYGKGSLNENVTATSSNRGFKA